jgi:hypothetical protein
MDKEKHISKKRRGGGKQEEQGWTLDGMRLTI